MLFEIMNNLGQLKLGEENFQRTYLIILVSARHHTLSWNKYLNPFPKKFVRSNPKVNLMIVFPEQ